jgi:hypothetical protein
MRNKRVPVIECTSDDFAQTFAGEEYHPHAGEKVWMVPYLSTSKTLALIEAADKLGGDNVNAGQLMRVMSQDIAPILAEVISHWTWTSVLNDEPLGKHDGNGVYRPTVETIGELSLEETTYLVGKYFDVRGGDEEEENPQ